MGPRADASTIAGPGVFPRDRARVHYPISIFLCGTLCSVASASDWSRVSPGIEYREMTLEGPVRVYIARADRSMKNWTIDTLTAQGTVKGARETVPDMVVRYNDSVNADGQRCDIKIAINGDYFNATTGVPPGGQVISGWFIRRYGEYTGGSGFVWTSDRRCVMGGNLRTLPYQHVIFADGSKMAIQCLNEKRADNRLALFTHHYAENTGTASDGAEVLICLSAPLAIFPPGGAIKGEIIRVRRDSGSTPLPYEHAVLSATGHTAEELLKHAHEGQGVGIAMELQDYGNEEIGLPPADWHNAYASLGGPKCVVVKGKVPHEWWEKKAERQIKAGGKSGAIIPDPRTAIAFNDRYVYFIVIDGRYAESKGMTFTEAGRFCADVLKAEYAVLQDGGGSSTMWVDGRVRNRPSGKPNVDEPGVLRPVANGYCMAILQAPQRSGAFKVDGDVTAGDGLQLRLGPGFQYGIAATVPAGRSGKIIRHSLDGIFAKRTHWWNCRFGDADGWVPQERIASGRR